MAIAVVFSPAAHAQGPAETEAPIPADTPDATLSGARAAFQEGINLARQARWAEALAAFQRSGNLHASATTTYNIGFCELSLARYTRAKKAFRSALSERDAQGAAALPEDLQKSAEQYLSDVEGSLARAKIHVDPDGSPVTVDGAPLEMLSPKEPPLAGTRPAGPGEPIGGNDVVVELDPGEHLFAVGDGGAPGAVVRRTLTPGPPVAILLRASSKALSSTEPREGAPTSAKPLSPKPGIDAEPSPTHLPMWVAFGFGAAGLATGGVAGILALEKRGKVGDECPGNRCPPGEPTSNLDAANTAATVATIGFAVGLAGAAAGVYFWLSEKPKPTRFGALYPSVGWRSAGLSGTF